MSFDERIAFIQLIRRSGVQMTSSRILDIREATADDGETDCWTLAYNHSLTSGSTYVEGICRLPPREDGRLRIAAHAWCVEETPLGLRVREFTPGYEGAWDYRGLPIRLDTPEAEDAEIDGVRYSVLELQIAREAARHGLA